jgi:Tol biopolymer transport system component
MDCLGPPAWSPDGSPLAFCAPGGIWVIGVDGLGLRKVVPNGENQSWSPDGSRITYQVRGHFFGTASDRGRRRWQRSEVHLG